MQLETRKVGAVIPIAEHTRLKVLAVEHGTTVEKLVRFGLANVPALLRDPSNLRKLERDGRKEPAKEK